MSNTEHTKPSGPSLEELAELHRTDKLEHGYMPYYQHHFEAYRERPVRLLEIGVGPGGSLRVWRDYFRRGQIVGIDTADKSVFESDRVHVYQGDQTDADFLRRVVREMGRVDIVIDDGSHINEQVLGSFEVLFPLLSNPGWYVIEDLHTSYWSPYGGEFRDLDTGRTTTSSIKTMIDGLHCHWIPGRNPSDRDLSINALHCYPKIVFISKGNNPRIHRQYELRMMRESLSGEHTGSGD